MLHLGLTGSIGMGKSTVAAMFRDLGVPVFDADAAVHALYARGGAAVAPMQEAFPDAVVDGAVDRQRLAPLVLGDAAALKRLEGIVHPLVGQMRQRFLAEAEAAGAPFVVLDIPLLFETGGEKNVDASAVVSAPAEAQRERVLARPGMTEEKFDSILAKQVPDAEKRERADFVIPTGSSLEETRDHVSRVAAAMRRRAEEGTPAAD
ncbi:dephospho-CoA kinase [Marinibaculum pumilum]|uniref:Dephospho-CoA kinase n=1 Tax=Marinibaculum pumilum TaxID=1766165 RepID=A0ABV7KUN2_9PROT